MIPPTNDATASLTGNADLAIQAAPLTGDAGLQTAAISSDSGFHATVQTSKDASAAARLHTTFEAFQANVDAVVRTSNATGA